VAAAAKALGIGVRRVYELQSSRRAPKPWATARVRGESRSATDCD
jgi:uncharacterized protein YggE